MGSWGKADFVCCHQMSRPPEPPQQAAAPLLRRRSRSQQRVFARASRNTRTRLCPTLLPPSLPPSLPLRPRSNNAGIQFVSPVETFPEDKWDDIIAVCLNSTFHATKHAVPHMLSAGWGRIINTGSMHALVVRRGGGGGGGARVSFFFAESKRARPRRGGRQAAGGVSCGAS